MRVQIPRIDHELNLYIRKYSCKIAGLNQRVSYTVLFSFEFTEDRKQS
jgi:hypothetical protein